MGINYKKVLLCQEQMKMKHFEHAAQNNFTFSEPAQQENVSVDSNSMDQSSKVEIGLRRISSLLL